jgi:hypothetical protein
MAESGTRTAGLTTGCLRLCVTADSTLTQTLIALPHEDALLKTETAQACPLDLTLPDVRVAGADWTAGMLYAGHDTVIATCTAAGVESRLTWSAGRFGALTLLVQLRLADDRTPVDGTLHLPLLDHLHPGDPDRSPEHDPGTGPLASDGRPLLCSKRHPLPLSWWSAQGGVLALVRYARDTQESMLLRQPPKTLPIRLRREWVDAYELILIACEPGWQGVFTAYRAYLRAGMDLSEYARPDIAWYRNQWLQHFTFLYGSEVFDHQRGQLDIVRLLDDGRRFGGYDGILFWPGYPRLGVDARSQWDFYDDLPGGRAALRECADAARRRSTRVFIPYLPWDAPPESRHGLPALAASELARAVAEIGADGVFLDTMDSVLVQFRQAIDLVRSGVVFCSEAQPGLDSLPLITGSWDQAPHERADEIDLQRFLFPERPTFMVNRHAVGTHRLAVLNRARFNATGLVVWQDIFGEMLPFTDAEAALTGEIVTVLRRYAGRFRGVDALPLIPTAHPDLYANAFIGGDGQAAVTVYNAGEQQINGELTIWSHDDGQVWARVRAEGAPIMIGGVPMGAVAPGECATFVSSERRPGSHPTPSHSTRE